MNLTNKLRNVYTKPAFTKTVNVGFGDPNELQAYTRQHIRLGVFLCLSYMAVCVGRPQGLPSSCNLGSPTLRTLPPLFGDFGGNGFQSLLQESQMTKKLNGQSRPQFNRDQTQLVDTIALSLEQLGSLFFLLLEQQESEHAHHVQFPQHSTFEPQVLNALYLAESLHGQIKGNFSKLISEDV